MLAAEKHGRGGLLGLPVLSAGGRVVSGYRFDGTAARAARQRTGKSLQKISIGLSRSGQIVTCETIRMWELGHSEPRVGQFFVLCDLLSVKPATLIVDVESE